jgi:hypothetical protein
LDASQLIDGGFHGDAPGGVEQIIAGLATPAARRELPPEDLALQREVVQRDLERKYSPEQIAAGCDFIFPMSRRCGCRLRRSISRCSAPRGALLYPRRSRDELEGKFVGLMANRDLKEKRDNRMPAKRRSCSSAEATRRGTRVIWQKLDCLKPNLQKTQIDVRRKGTWYRRRLWGGIVQRPPQPSQQGALSSEGNQGDEWDA